MLTLYQMKNLPQFVKNEIKQPVLALTQSILSGEKASIYNPKSYANTDWSNMVECKKFLLNWNAFSGFINPFTCRENACSILNLLYKLHPCSTLANFKVLKMRHLMLYTFKSGTHMKKHCYHVCPHFDYYSQNKQQEQFHIKVILPFCMMFIDLESLRVACQLIFTSTWVENKGWTWPNTSHIYTLLCGLTSASWREDK